MCHLRAMNAYEFEHYMKSAVENYANELVKSGMHSKKDAMKESQKTFDYLLPDGIDTKDQFLYHIINETDAIVGMIWYGIRPNHEGFIYDFSILEPFRNQGLGTTTLELIEDEAKAKGLKKIGLHVFGHNVDAIRLYKRMGYDITSMNMSKEI